MRELNQELMEDWKAALRSGEYRQGRGYLCRVIDEERKYCCLGVLMELYYGNVWKDANGNGISLRKQSCFEDHGSVLSIDGRNFSELSPVLRKWIADNGVVQHSLVVANDIHKNTFSEIADMLP